MNSHHLFQRCVDGHTVSEDDVDRLLSEKIAEDIHLDYKSGRLVGGNDDSRSRLRKAIAAFANSDGGIIVLGVNGGDVDARSSVPWAVDGCPFQVGGVDAQSWLQAVTTPLLPFLSPLPKYQSINHRFGLIFIIIVFRSNLLVPCFSKAGDPCFYMRFYDGTHRLPEYLVADLVTGRRQRPSFSVDTSSKVNYPREIEPWNFTQLWEPQYRAAETDTDEEREKKRLAERRVMDRVQKREYLRPWTMEFRVSIRNHALTWADDAVVGFLAPSLHPPHPRDTPISPDLKSYVDLSQLTEPFGLSHSIQIISKPTPPMMELLTTSWTITVPSLTRLRLGAKTVGWLDHKQSPRNRLPPGTDAMCGIEVMMAIYVLARNGFPAWWQCRVSFDEIAKDCMVECTPVSGNSASVGCRIIFTDPQVAQTRYLESDEVCGRLKDSMLFDAGDKVGFDGFEAREDDEPDKQTDRAEQANQGK